jgi:hypothetical protein
VSAPRIHGQFDGGFAWQPRPDHFMEQSSTALVHDGRVYLIDPLLADGIDQEIKTLGTVAAIIMTVGWHDRDVDWFAALYGVPVYAYRRLIRGLVRSTVQHLEGEVPGSPFRLIDCSGRGVLGWWTESALWWPDASTLVTGDCLGNATYFTPSGERLAVHPIRRLSPPNRLYELPVERLYVGHGTSLESGASAEIQRSIDAAPSDLPRGLLRSARTALRSLTRSR